MKKSILYILIVVTHTLFSQELSFEQNFVQEVVYGVKNTTYGYCISQTQNKGVIIGGSSQFDSYDFVWEHTHAIRLSPLGEVEWQQSYFQNQSSPSEEVVYPFIKVLFHPATNRWFGIVNSNKGDVILTKHFESGEMQWQKEIYDSISNYPHYRYHDMTFSSDSNAIYLDIYYGEIKNLLRKYSLDGELLWENRDLEEYNLYADPYQQRFFVYGRHSNDEVVFHDINEENGVLINSYITHGFDKIYDIKAREGGGYWCIGYTLRNYYSSIAALDEQMDTLWTKNLQGPQHPISYYSNSYIVFSEFFPNSNVHIVTCNQKYYTEPYRGLVIALDTNMDTLWTYQHFKGDTFSYIRDATRLKDGSLVVAGTYGVQNVGNLGMFIFKISVDGSVGLSESMPFQDKVPYPNPTNSVLHTHNNTEKSIYNLQGQLLWQGKDKSIDVRHWQKDMYLLKTKDKTYRWIKQ